MNVPAQPAYIKQLCMYSLSVTIIFPMILTILLTSFLKIKSCARNQSSSMKGNVVSVKIRHTYYSSAMLNKNLYTILPNVQNVITHIGQT